MMMYGDMYCAFRLQNIRPAKIDRFAFPSGPATIDSMHRRDSNEEIVVSVADGVAIITLNLPKKLNALSLPL